MNMLIRHLITLKDLTDLCITSDEFETVWIEIKNQKNKNILCSSIYRHPSSDKKKENILNNFISCDTHIETNEFVNTVNANFSYLIFFSQPELRIDLLR